MKVILVFIGKEGRHYTEKAIRELKLPHGEDIDRVETGTSIRPLDYGQFMYRDLKVTEEGPLQTTMTPGNPYPFATACSNEVHHLKLPNTLHCRTV